MSSAKAQARCCMLQDDGINEGKCQAITKTSAHSAVVRQGRCEFCETNNIDRHIKKGPLD
ncbi:hypothetical protein GMI70_05780 [Eggerthellaceae bacterium zg-893]|nr:hypothetical protein [Eggerthellaceae bacterium zg-893]